MLPNQFIEIRKFTDPLKVIFTQIHTILPSSILISKTGEAYNLDPTRRRSSAYIIKSTSNNIIQSIGNHHVDHRSQVRSRNCFWLAWNDVYKDSPIMMSWSYKVPFLIIKCNVCQRESISSKMPMDIYSHNLYDEDWSTSSCLLVEFMAFQNLLRYGCEHSDIIRRLPLLMMNDLSLTLNTVDHRVISKYYDHLSYLL